VPYSGYELFSPGLDQAIIMALIPQLIESHITELLRIHDSGTNQTTG
jgi:hypothetical protein